jgi:competence protein ComEC
VLKYPAVAACICLAAGLLLGDWLTIPDFAGFCILSVLVVLSATAVWQGRKLTATILVALCLAFAGLVRLNLLTSNLPANHISGFNGLESPVTINGLVINEPDRRIDRTFLTIDCDSLLLNGLSIPTSGLLLVRLFWPEDKFNYADRISVSGYLNAPFENRNLGAFSFKRYLELRRIHSVMNVKHISQIRYTGTGRGSSFLLRLVIPLRKYVLNVFESQLAGSEKYLAAGFVIGETRFMPENLYKQFKDTGTLHLLAVSGSNVALVVLIFAVALRAVGVRRRYTYLVSLGVILVFCELSFNQPSVVRASIMLGLILLGKIAYRPSVNVNVIAAAALLILLVKPMMLFDVGFQLSFAAAFGLIYFLPGLMPDLRGHRSWIKSIRNYGLTIAIASVIAQLSVAPILISNFGEVPLISFASNLFVIPAASVSLMLCVVLVLSASIPILGGVASILTQVSLHASVKLVDLFASLPVTKIHVGTLDLVDIVFYYSLLFLGYHSLRVRKYRKWLLYATLTWINVIVWSSLLEGYTTTGCITFPDLKNSAAMHVHMPNSVNFVVTKWDNSIDSSYAKSELEDYLVREGIRNLSPQQLLAGGKSGVILLSDIQVYAEKGKPEIRTRIDGDQLVELWNSDGHLSAAVFEMGGFRWGWYADWATIDLLCDSTSSGLDVIAVPDPTRSSGSDLETILEIAPRLVIIYNYESYSSRRIIQLFGQELNKAGIELMSTAEYGAIRLELAGGKMKVLSAITGGQDPY